MSTVAGQRGGAVVGGMIASGVLLVSATWLPWATYRSVALSVPYRGGKVGQVLVVCGAAWLTLAITSAVWNRHIIYWLQISISTTALVVSVVLTLMRIAAANGTPDPHLALGGTVSTAHGIGAELAVAASGVMIACSVIQLRLSRVADKCSASISADRTRIR